MDFLQIGSSWDHTNTGNDKEIVSTQNVSWLCLVSEIAIKKNNNPHTPKKPPETHSQTKTTP